MKKFYLMILSIVILAGIIAMSGCKKDDSTEQDDALGDQGILTVSGTFNGHDYVDLGLPSGTLWATCNIGSDIPEGYGDYFAWGETTTKETYNWSNYKYCNGDYDKITKYCNDSSYGNNGFTDALKTLEASDDAATVNWGAGWRMPTQTELNELYNCTHECVTKDGVTGEKFTGPNGNSVFIPTAGYIDRSYLLFSGSYGYGDIWSSSLGADHPSCARSLFFGYDLYGMSDNSRCHGQTVRPVCVLQK